MCFVPRDFWTDFERLKSFPSNGVFKVVGNLPYNITSPILRRLSNDRLEIRVPDAFKEVAERLCAKRVLRIMGVDCGMSLTCEADYIFVNSPQLF